MIADGAGTKMRVTVWEHDDIMPLKGKELIIHGSKNGKGVFGGINVKHDSYPSKKETNPDGTPKVINTIELSIAKNGLFQEVAVFHQSKGTAPAPAPISEATSSNTAYASGGQSYVNGQTVGMAVKLAGDIILSEGYNADTFQPRLITLASQIIKVSKYLEQGGAEAKPTPVAAPAQAVKETPIVPTHFPKNPQPASEEDVPF